MLALAAERANDDAQIVPDRRHFVARNTDHSGVIRGTIFDIDKEYYHVDWGEWGKKLVPISWVETLKPWTLTCRRERDIN